MTVPGLLAEQLAGPARCVRLLDGSPEESMRFSSWFCPVWRGKLDDDLVGEAYEAWARVVDDDAVFAWWCGAACTKPALPRAVLARGLAGVARVEALPGGDWVPAEAPARGRPAVTWCETWDDPAKALDLIAMNPADPAQWRRRMGLCDVLPHNDDVWRLEDGQKIRLFEAPLGWLAAGCPTGGFCVLDWASWPARELLGAIAEGRIAATCDGDAHAARVKALARPKRAPLRIRVAAATVLEAAE